MGKKKTKIDKIFEEYEYRFGDIPSNQEDILKYLREKYPRLNMDIINAMANDIDNIPWEKESYTVLAIPKPGQRPRYSFETEHFYVPGSASNKEIMRRVLGIGRSVIHSRVKVKLHTYQLTPSYKMNQNEIYLAELGKIRPLIDPDFDNFTKAYMDAIQGLLISDDNIITDAEIIKYFSFKPRIFLELEYQLRPDSKYNEKVLLDRLNRKKK